MRKRYGEPEVPTETVIVVAVVLVVFTTFVVVLAWAETQTRKATRSK